MVEILVAMGVKTSVAFNLLPAKLAQSRKDMLYGKGEIIPVEDLW